MKIISSLLFIFLISSCVSGKERTYVGSTPADNVVKSFLGIPLSDSIDFIRWKLIMQDENYILECNYGIGQPNTNGFMQGGKRIEINGSLQKERSYYSLRNADKTLNVLEINTNLLHLLSTDKSLLIGNGGWSYTLNMGQPSNTDQANITSKQNSLKDSMAFQGRTPCGDFSINRASSGCIKMKWSIIFYANAHLNEPTTYSLGRNRISAGKTGTWKIITGKDGRIIYQLSSDNDSTPTYFLKLDENILIFTDEQGKLLVGDEDFSYTLNRRSL